MRVIMRHAWLPFAFALAGCGYFRSPAPVQEEVVTETAVRLGDKTDISLADWLAKPRAELARLADDKQEAVVRLQEFTRHSAEAVDLLPKLHLSVRVPVFEKAGFSETVGFSLPP